MAGTEQRFVVVDIGYGDKRYQVVRQGNVIDAYRAKYIAHRIADALNDAQDEDAGEA